MPTIADLIAVLQTQPPEAMVYMFSPDSNDYVELIRADTHNVIWRQDY